jgi:transcriptional regulator with XRE-family HTH domain
MNEVGKLIKKYRILIKKTQADIAGDLKVSTNYISLIENGRKNPGNTFIKDFSTEYNIPIILLSKSSIIPRGKNIEEKQIEKQLLRLVGEIEALTFMRYKNERASKDKH